jgi:hypothetical protein
MVAHIATVAFEGIEATAIDVQVQMVIDEYVII